MCYLGPPASDHDADIEAEHECDWYQVSILLAVETDLLKLILENI